MNDKVMQIIRYARTENAELRRRLIETETSADPALDFCRTVSEYGFELSLFELMISDEENADLMLKSTNGGATYPFDYLSDTLSTVYDMLKG